MASYEAAVFADDEVVLGHVVRADSATLSIALGDPNQPESARRSVAAAKLGSIVRINAPRSVAFGVVSGLSREPSPTEVGSFHGGAVEVELIGEAERSSDGEIGPFHRGVTAHPTLGAAATRATRRDLVNIYDIDEEHAVAVGRVFQDPSIPAKIRINELLAKHFAVLGTTGTGKSCTVALLMHAILSECPNAHLLLIDPHAEYATAFRGKADVIAHHDLRIPYWALCYEELVEILFPDRKEFGDQIEVLADLIRQAKAMFAAQSAAASPNATASYRRRASDVSQFSEDTPVPYRLSDVVKLVDDRLGALDHQNDIVLYRRLRNRIDTRVRDERYAFVFGAAAAKTTLAEVFSRFFRLPVAGKPVAILELAGLPSEVLSVVVCIVSRLAFEFGLRSGGTVPLTLICEEAHNYIPADRERGFTPARRALGRIAKEGRKYGVSLGVVTQRPAELDPTILSQCSTLVAMRLTNDRDQEIVASAVADNASGLVGLLSALVSGEGIVFGDGFAIPMRLRFDLLEPDDRPSSSSAEFAKRWRDDDLGRDLAAEVANRIVRNEFPPVLTMEAAPGIDATDTGGPLFGGRRAGDVAAEGGDRRSNGRHR